MSHPEYKLRRAGTDALSHSSSSISHIFMAEVDWDAKVVIGSKAPRPKVTKTDSDLNGMYLSSDVEVTLVSHLGPSNSGKHSCLDICI